MSVILVTHDLGVIAGRADRVAVMYAGKIVETTDTGTLFANPRHPYTEALFHALPDKAAETKERLYSIPGVPPDLTHPPAGCRFAAALPVRDRPVPRRRSRGWPARRPGTSSPASTRSARLRMAGARVTTAFEQPAARRAGPRSSGPTG